MLTKQSRTNIFGTDFANECYGQWCFWAGEKPPSVAHVFSHDVLVKRTGCPHLSINHASIIHHTKRSQI